MRSPPSPRSHGIKSTPEEHHRRWLVRHAEGQASRTDKRQNKITLPPLAKQRGIETHTLAEWRKIWGEK